MRIKVLSLNLQFKSPAKLMYIKILFAFFIILVSNASFAKIKIPATIGSNMVLQRNSEAKIWGWGDPGQKITVKASWLPNELSTNVSNDGRWQVKLLTGNAGGPYKLTIAAPDDVINLENILLGEVWICSGQSNMEFTINMLGGWNKVFPVERDELVKSDHSFIRLFTVEKDTSSRMQENCRGNWLVADTATVADFSGTAWFYGLELSKRLKVPVGLIVSAWGGTAAEAWTPKPVVDQDTALQFYRSDPNKNPWFPNYLSVLYNAMICPLHKTSIKGAIWYQGEANVTDAVTYKELFTAMVRGWRQSWGLGDFPFYYVQIAPFAYDRAVVGALLREAQLKSLSAPNSGMAVTMDITGDVSDIHPKNKQEVGKRLALWAMAGTYYADNVIFSGPIYKEFKKEDKHIRISFDFAENGLTVKGPERDNGFMIAGDDRHFLPAKVKVEGNSILVKSDKVKDPVAVRYAFTNTSVATLFNSSGLPASSFRTDNWPVVTDIVLMKPVFNQTSGNILYDLSSSNPQASIHYSLNGTEPTCNSLLYSGEPIGMLKPGMILARACVDNVASESIGSWEIMQHKGMAANVSYVNSYSSKYSAGGAYGLVDGVEGTLAFNDGAWQGFEGSDLDITIDLGESTMVRRVVLHFLSDTNSWIFPPKHVEIRTSKNGVNFDPGSRFDNINSMIAGPGNIGKQILSIHAPFMKNARYIKVKASSIKICPPGHPGAGKKCWLFVDEVEVE
jgi:sialate O-acetylesterase